MTRLRGPILVMMGILGRSPFAGIVWQILHYLEGFRRLGYDVYYIEDTQDWPYDADRHSITQDPTYTIANLSRVMQWCGMGGKFAYRSGADGHVRGMSESQVARLFDRAAVLVNLTGATRLRDGHLRVPTRIYIETDPVRPQIEVALGNQPTIELLRSHTHHFTFGENIGQPDCDIPVSSFHYRPTRQPIVLDWWSRAAAPIRHNCPAPFTTISNWDQTGNEIVWKDEVYFWSKHLEFLKFLDLPSRTDQVFELALSSVDARSSSLLRARGWKVADALALSKHFPAYRNYIQTSRGEFTVAKDQNIRLSSGWFSDRSACYLASGRPVVTQDTGFGRVLPTGRGLFAFRNVDDILAAIAEIKRDYQGNCRAARELAVEHFASDTVLWKLLQEAGCAV